MRKNLFYALLILVLSQSSCGISHYKKDDGNFEGIITYQVTYPENTEDPLHGLYPDQLTIYVKNGKALGILESIGFSNKSFLDLDKGEYESFVDFMIPSMKSKIVMDKEAIKEKNFSKYTFEKTRDKQKLAGTKCYKIKATDTETGETKEIWATDKIQISGFNQVGPYPQLSDLLLEYEMEQFGMSARITATNIKSISLDDSTFVRPKGYETIPEESLINFIDSTYRLASAGK